MKKILFVLMIVGLALAACVPATTSSSPTADLQVETIVAATMQAMTVEVPVATKPAQVLGGFAYNNISFVIPNGLASGAIGETIPRADDAEGMPYWGVAPEFSMITLQNYVTGERFHKPQIFVFPVDEFVQMNEAAAQNINDLRNILPGTAPLPAELPHLPLFNAAQMFTAQGQVINFQSGRGVRYVTQYSQAFIPVNNNELFYTFQGLTSDGKYYVSLQVPITAAILDTMSAPDVNSPTFTGEEWGTYTQGIAKTLDSLGPIFFSPTLETLDAFVATITITP